MGRPTRGLILILAKIEGIPSDCSFFLGKPSLINKEELFLAC